MKSLTPPFGRTQTWVHTEESMMMQRKKAEIRQNWALSGLSLYGQLMIGLSLYLYDHVSTPGYFSVLLVLPFLLMLCLACRWMLRKHQGDNRTIFSAAGNRMGKFAAILWALICWLDGQLAFYALCSMVSNILPTISSFLVALAIAVTVAFALGGRGREGLARLSRLMGWLIFLCILYCAAIGFPYGDDGHLFPLLGYGPGRIFRGGLWLCGCAASACLALLLPGEKLQEDALRENRKCMRRSLGTAVVLAAITALLSAYLLPLYALARPETTGYRLLLLARITPSVAAWSLLVCATMFLMLMTLGTGVQRGAQLFSIAAGKKEIPFSLTTGLLLSYVPWGALNIQPLEDMLIRIAPYRSGMAILALMLLFLGGWRTKWKNATEKEADA